ncbi:MAG: enoyl-CoA hydratase/isomerase family protein [Gammaproteobacteria bacterium]|nr:enoyl-CoA hydratase/isomerase family protein [Gammaproteobacteria bacterium]
MQIDELRTHFDDYSNRYESISMRREDGILEMTLGTDGGPLQWGRRPHAELEEAFLNIGRDRQNQVVIMTGTGAAFSGPVAEAESNRAAHRQTPDEWAELGWESNRLLANLLAIDVPMISAVNGPAARHAELPVMCDIVLAAENASFQDSAHFTGGLVPGDGVHVVFPLIMGLNRGRYFLLTGQVIGAQQALEYGLVNEVLPTQQLLPRAWELARQIMQQPEMNRRYTRLLLTEQLRRQLQQLLPYGLALEGLAITR